jgi:hypothetical protein
LAAIRPAFSKNATDKRHVIAIRPPELFLRMMVQLSVFTIHGRGMLVEEINEKETLLVKYRIPYSAKKSIRNELIRLGIRESNIFPDLDHLGDEVSGIKFIDPPKQEISYLDLSSLSYDSGVRGVESST